MPLNVIINSKICFAAVLMCPLLVIQPLLQHISADLVPVWL